MKTFLAAPTILVTLVKLEIEASGLSWMLNYLFIRFINDPYHWLKNLAHILLDMCLIGTAQDCIAVLHLQTNVGKWISI